MLFKWILGWFKPRPPKYTAGDVVMFESEHRDYEAKVLGFDRGSEALALQITSVPRKNSKWDVGDKITIGYKYDEHKTLVIVSNEGPIRPL